jgi:pimeloyl-ACP methyl ester carboxylesterase
MLEYPGYGKRPGSPSQDAFNAAALSAYHSLLNRYGGEKLIVAGASLGSGVASYLATAQQPPRHIVLIVPFHVLTDVAQERFPWLPVGLLMVDRWNNGKALENFRGKLDVFGGRHDHVIPVHHARRLVASRSGARYHEYDGGHDWFNGFVDLRVIE